MVRGLCAVWLILWLSVAGAMGQPYDGPPDGADYWTVPAFKEFPLKGPQAARGIVLWSHGVKGREAQYQYTPNQVVKRFARAGWDVVKVQRNPRNERGWIPSGTRHVRDLVERADKAKAEGYKQVIAAGQSYGGAISVEAAGKTKEIDGVLAMAPGHGSDAAGSGSARMFDSLTDQLIAAIGRVQAPRLVIMIAENDIYHPFEVRGPKLRAALTKHGTPFVLFDETMPLKGHGAGATWQFDEWYGQCILSFLTQAKVKEQETQCAGPLVMGVFVLPSDLKIGAPSAGTPSNVAEFTGSWTGLLAKTRPVRIVFEGISAGSVKFVYALAAEGNAQPLYYRRTATWESGHGQFVSRNKTNQFSISLKPPRDSAVVEMRVTGSKGEVWDVELTRGVIPQTAP